jgi:hypothetical protein
MKTIQAVRMPQARQEEIPPQAQAASEWRTSQTDACATRVRRELHDLKDVVNYDKITP